MGNYKNYNILLSPSASIFNFCMVTVLSAILNCKKKCNFYIMQSDWSDEQKKIFTDFIAEYPGNTVTIINVNDSDFHDFSSWKGHYETYYKILSHIYIHDDIDRILYLDSGDVIINKDIENFYNMEFGDNYIIGCTNTNSLDDFIARTEQVWRQGNVNCGVLLLNIDKLRTNNITIDYYKVFLQEINDKYLVDQGLLTYIFKGKFKILSNYKYNFNLTWAGNSSVPYSYKWVFALPKEERIGKTIEQYWYEDFDENEVGSIVHFCGVGIRKPWDCFVDKDGKNDKNLIIPSLRKNLTLEDVDYLYIRWWEIAEKIPFEQYYEILTVASNNAKVAPLNKKLTYTSNVLNFFETISYDLLNKSTFIQHIQIYREKKVSLLKTNSMVGRFLVRVLEQNHINVIFKTMKITLNGLSDEEWAKCKQADAIISCDIHGSKPIERDGIKPIMISDIINDPTLPTSDHKELITYNALAEIILAELKSFKENAENRSEALRAEIKELHSDNDSLNTKLSQMNTANNDLNTELSKINAELSKSTADNAKLNAELGKSTADNAKLNAELSKSTADNAKLNAELSKLSGEKKQLTERLNAADKRTEALSKERDSLNKTIAKLESEVDRFESDLNNASAQNTRLSAALSESSSNIETANAQIKLLNTEKNKLVIKIQESNNIINELMDKLAEMESSRSWRITKPLRSIMRFFRSLFGKKADKPRRRSGRTDA